MAAAEPIESPYTWQTHLKLEFYSYFLNLSEEEVELAIFFEDCEIKTEIFRLDLNLS